jgi:hypothetical protein
VFDPPPPGEGKKALPSPLALSYAITLPGRGRVKRCINDARLRIGE